MKHNWKNKGLLLQKGEKCDEITETAFQNSRHIREGLSNPSHIRGGMSRNDVGMEILCIFLDMRFGGVLNYVRTHSRANRDVATAFERQSKDSDGIRIAFQLNSLNIETDSGSNRDSPSNAIRMLRMLLECHNGP